MSDKVSYIEASLLKRDIEIEKILQRISREKWYVYFEKVLQRKESTSIIISQYLHQGNFGNGNIQDFGFYSLSFVWGVAEFMFVLCIKCL